MAFVITVAQQKGGTGKTTLAANLATCLAGGRRVALLDIDPQRSLTRWFGVRSARERPAAPLTLSDVSGWRLAAELQRLRQEHDIVIIDTPPQIDTDARLAIRGADLVLIPIQPSEPDAWAAEGTLKLAADEKRRAAIVFNRVPPSSKLRDTIAERLIGRGLPLLAVSLGNRTAFATAFAEGLGVTETMPRSTAAAETRALLDELMGLLR